MVSQKNVLLTKNDVSSDTTYVFAVNHRSYLDAFLICYALEFRIQLIQGPYRFFLKNSFLDNWFLRGLLLAFGCFPVNKHEKYPHGLQYAKELIKDGQTVMIFPEGRISRSNRELEPKSGVSVMAKMNNVSIIPARIDWDRDKKHFRSYKLAIGKPFIGDNMTPEQIMDMVYHLDFDSKKA